jgi:hypothetical protein
MADDKQPRAPQKLRDGEITTEPTTRRGALLSVLGTMLAGRAQAQAPQAPPLENDSDSGPPGQVTGFTDRDRGKQADPPGNGRGTQPSAIAVTDFDSGAHADRRGRGRGGRGLGSDNDTGARADPVGEGRRRPTKR